MTSLTDVGRRRVEELAHAHAVSIPTAEAMAHAVARGGGTMAQFNIPELGGSGQWMSGGMTMVGNMFDHQLQARVSGLCGDLAQAIAGGDFFKPPASAKPIAWWPPELGQPSSSGGQNQIRYAYFPAHRRIAIDLGNGRDIVLLDTGDHQIGGFGQQQSGPADPFAGVSFSSQLGQFSLSSLPRITDKTEAEPTRPEETKPEATVPPAKTASPSADVQKPDIPPETPTPTSAAASSSDRAPEHSVEDTLNLLERLAKLRDAGVLSEDEFSAKKAELLKRL